MASSNIFGSLWPGSAPGSQIPVSYSYGLQSKPEGAASCLCSQGEEGPHGCSGFVGKRAEGCAGNTCACCTNKAWPWQALQADSALSVQTFHLLVGVKTRCIRCHKSDIYHGEYGFHGWHSILNSTFTTLKVLNYYYYSKYD